MEGKVGRVPEQESDDYFHSRLAAKIVVIQSATMV